MTSLYCIFPCESNIKKLGIFYRIYNVIFVMVTNVRFSLAFICKKIFKFRKQKMSDAKPRNHRLQKRAGRSLNANKVL